MNFPRPANPLSVPEIHECDKTNLIVMCTRGMQLANTGVKTGM